MLYFTPVIMHLLSSSMKRTGLSYRKEQFVCIASKNHYGVFVSGQFNYTKGTGSVPF